MTAFDFCGLALILAGMIGIIIKRSILANVVSFQVILMGLALMACRGFMFGFARPSFQLVFFLLFISNVFFLLFIGAIYRLVKDFYLKEEV